MIPDQIDRIQDLIDERYESWMRDEIAKMQMAEKPKKLAKEVA